MNIYKFTMYECMVNLNYIIITLFKISKSLYGTFFNTIICMIYAYETQFEEN